MSPGNYRMSHESGATKEHKNISPRNIRINAIMQFTPGCQRRKKGDTGQYKEYGRVYRKAVKAAQMAYYAEQFKANASNFRKTWGLVRECQGKFQIRYAIPQTFTSGGQQVTGVF